MNNRLTRLFAEKKADLLSIFYTAGYPYMGSVVAIAETLEALGVDFIEIGIPFSDSLVDGPVIQASNEVALANGMNMESLFAELEELRSRVSMPVILMGCINPVMQYGVEKFCKRLHELEIDGALIADLPPDVFEQEYKSLFDENQISFISLVTRHCKAERVRYLDGLSKGFLYVVSSDAVTGGELGELEELKNLTGVTNPTMLGFGIRDAESFQAACKQTNGAIIGSAFIRALEGASASDIKGRIRDFIGSIR